MFYITEVNLPCSGGETWADSGEWGLIDRNVKPSESVQPADPTNTHN